MKYSLAVFDLDGTILNTLNDLADSVNVILEKYNFPLHSTEEIRFMVGNGMPKLIQRAIPQGEQNPAYNNFLNDFISYYDIHKTDKTAPYDGIPELLLKLKKDGVKLAVNSNKLETAVIPLCQKYFPGIFDYFAGGHLDRAPKPDPAGVNSILIESKVEKAKAVFIGDSDVDVATAKNSGLDFIGCGWGFRGTDFLMDHGAEKVADYPDEIIKIMTK